MLQAALLIIPIVLLGPLWICTLTFRVWFPRQILKVNQMFLLPISFIICLFTNGFQLYYAMTWLPQYCCDGHTYLNLILSKFTQNGVWGFYKVIVFILIFYCAPALVTAVVSILAKFLWTRAASEDAWSFTKFIGKGLVGQMFNFMGHMTAHDPKVENLMVDVLTEDGFLYCGKYSDYFIDKDGALQGVVINHVIRYKLTYGDKGLRLSVDPYLLPNQGVMYFPNDRIKNFHIWKIKDNDTLKGVFDKDKKESSITFLWYCILQYVSEININLVLDSSKDTDSKVTEEFFKHLDNWNIPAKDLRVTVLSS